MDNKNTFISGGIMKPLITFTFPVLFALVLQAMYGAVDLLVIGRFGTSADVSAVSTGSQIMQTITGLIVGLSMGTTVLLGQAMGRNDKQSAAAALGSGIWLFAGIGIAVTAAMLLCGRGFVDLMQTPEKAHSQAVKYVLVCSSGTLLITAYNVLGSVFRGLGDSKTPLMAVFFACLGNVVMDLLFVAVFRMGAAGAALATVLAQGVSVAIAFIIIKKRGLSFPFKISKARPDMKIIGQTLKLGVPIALQDLLVSVSFLVLLAIVNSLGLIASAGMGVAEKLTGFIMLVPSAFMQSMTAFVAQNIGAGERRRAKRAMAYGMFLSLTVGVVMAGAAFFFGKEMAFIFTTDAMVASTAADYLHAYAIDTLLVSFMFCFCGYFNGCGRTTFVMIQGILGAFLVRIPVAYFVSRISGVSLFYIGLATPCSTLAQIVMCCVYYYHTEHKAKA